MFYQSIILFLPSEHAGLYKDVAEVVNVLIWRMVHRRVTEEKAGCLRLRYIVWYISRI